MQCGTPVVCSNTSSLPEVTGDAALLVPPADAEAIDDAISSVLNDPNLRRSLSERSLQRSAAFSWDRYIDRTLEAYRRASDH